MSQPLGNQGVSSVQYQTSSNAAPVTVDATALTGYTLLPGQRLLIQNLAAAALYVKYGATCTTSSFTFIIPACTAANDGTVPPFIVDDWIGVVSLLPASGTVRFLATVLS